MIAAISDKLGQFITRTCLAQRTTLYLPAFTLEAFFQQATFFQKHIEVRTVIHGKTRTMNSMNFISSFGSIGRRRANAGERSSSNGNSIGGKEVGGESDAITAGTADLGDGKFEVEEGEEHDINTVKQEEREDDMYQYNDKTSDSKSDGTTSGSVSRPNIAKRTLNTVAGLLFSMLTLVLTPCRYIIACFYDEQGRFSTVHPFLRMGRALSRKRKRDPFGTSHSHRAAENKHATTARRRSDGEAASRNTRPRLPASSIFPSSSSYSSTTDASDPDSDQSALLPSSSSVEDSPSRHTRSKSLPLAFSTNDTPTTIPKRSIRIKVVNEESLRRRSQASPSSTDPSRPPPLTVATIKSSHTAVSAARLDRYPKLPAPPRPLVPRRQPSHSRAPLAAAAPAQKTLVLDLDETLIHSMAKGGRMSTGHMVEVKLTTPVGVDGAVLGPQVPILYYVHKRPHCDEFLRKVSPPCSPASSQPISPRTPTLTNAPMRMQIGQQVVQPHRLHRLCAGVRRSSH